MMVLSAMRKANMTRTNLEAATDEVFMAIDNATAIAKANLKPLLSDTILA